MFYVPNLDDYSCVYMQSNNVMRAYKETPRANSSVHYVDYMVDNHYLYREGSQTFNNIGSNLPTCLDSSVLSDNFYYRTDITDILICFTIFIAFNYILISKLIKLFFRGSKVY